VPPLSEADWHDAFDKYRQIPQYQQVNKGMSLGAFKRIFWWEWAHRFLGRLVGFAFLVPFLVLLGAGRIPRTLLPRLVGIFALGGLQGFIGWYMVSSGLVDRISVSQYRLAVHLGLAILILGALLWVALSLDKQRDRPGATAARERTGVGSVETLDLSATPDPRVTVVERVASSGAAVSIDDAQVVVAGGRGVAGPDGFAVIDDLADAFGGAVAGTRAVVDAGWLPYAQQVGQTGKIIKPALSEKPRRPSHGASNQAEIVGSRRAEPLHA